MGLNSTALTKKPVSTFSNRRPLLRWAIILAVVDKKFVQATRNVIAKSRAPEG